MRSYKKRYKRKKKIPFWKLKFFWFFILFFLFFSGNFYLIFLSPLFQVKKIEVFREGKLREGIEKLALTQIGKNLLFFQTKSIFFVDFEKISKFILEKFPQIERIEFSRKFPNKIELKIFERAPALIFCSEKCFFVDKEGIAFEEFEDEKNFFVEIEEKIELGKSALEKEFLKKILKIKEILERDFKIELEKMKIVSKERINVKTKESWEIHFNPQKNIDWQLIKLEVVLAKEIPLEKRKNLEYIELRFGNLAPYKMKSINIEDKD